MKLQKKHNLTGAGACDCHVHVVGPITEFPQIAARPYTAGPATLDLLRAAAQPLGVSRYVLVQPSFYGADNSFLLKTLDLLKGNGRGVVVVEPETVNSRKLEELAECGVCGVRINLYSNASPSEQAGLGNMLKRLTGLLPRGWHIEILAPLTSIAPAAQIIGHAEAPIIIDHYGLPDENLPQSEQGRVLLGLLRLPHVWIKLSAPYRVNPDPLATVPPVPWLEAFLDIAPDRCVWGSDWPHTPPQRALREANALIPYREIDYKTLLNDFLAALPQKELAERILHTNPVRFYGFAPTRSSSA